MTFNEFWNTNDVTAIWIATVGTPNGVELTHNVNTDCIEDYCDLGELINESQFDWLNELEGEVFNKQWYWSGEGSPRYLTISVLAVRAS